MVNSIKKIGRGFNHAFQHVKGRMSTKHLMRHLSLNRRQEGMYTKSRLFKAKKISKFIRKLKDLSTLYDDYVIFDPDDQLDYQIVRTRFMDKTQREALHQAIQSEIDSYYLDLDKIAARHPEEKEKIAYIKLTFFWVSDLIFTKWVDPIPQAKVK